jgi:hypothetical protein
LSRHRTGHMPGDLLVRLRVRGNRSDEELAQIREVESKSLLDNFVWQRSRLYANADMCVSIGDAAGERAAIGEAGRVTERIGKLLGELGAHITINNTQVNITAHPDYHGYRTAIMRGLRCLPLEMAQVVIREIEEYEARQIIAPVRQVLEHVAA